VILATRLLSLSLLRNPTVRCLGSLVLLVLLCGILFFYRLGDRELNSSHEARAAQNAQSILDNEDWLLPQLFDRQVELQKPPLYYWLVALAGQWQRGEVDARAVRLPAALSALATVLVVFGLAWSGGRPVAALLAGAMLATCLHFTWLARVGRIDMPLTLTTTVALAGFDLGLRRCREQSAKGASAWYLLAYLALSAGLLLKGPIALVLPAAVAAAAGAWSLVRGRWLAARLGESSPAAGDRTNRTYAWRTAGLRHHSPLTHHFLGLWWGVPLTFLLVLPWYWAANVQTGGDLFQVFFWYHNWARGFGGAAEWHSHPWWFYGPRLLYDLFPWSLLLVPAAWRLVRQQERDSLAGLGLVWFVPMLLFLSCMRFKRADYLLPAYPGAALFLGGTLERWWLERRVSSPLRAHWLAVCWAVVLVGCVAGWGRHVAWVIPAREAAQPERRLAEEIRRHTSLPVVFFRTEAHDLAFHVRAPVATLLEWENLKVWAARPQSYYVLMPDKEAAHWPEHLSAGQLVEVLRTSELTSGPSNRPLVLLRTQPRRNGG
jgi:4-amino-4-deoxy-L-arabinose transferase-like glycosyltransferase